MYVGVCILEVEVVCMMDCVQLLLPTGVHILHLIGGDGRRYPRCRQSNHLFSELATDNVLILRVKPGGNRGTD
jgi:hypothetical protein